MSDTPSAVQLRLLQTIVEVAAEKNSTLVLPFPVELLRFLENQGGGTKTAVSAIEKTVASLAESGTKEVGSQDGSGAKEVKSAETPLEIPIAREIEEPEASQSRTESHL